MSATPEYYSIVTQQPGSECLPPLTNFSFPVGVIGDLGNITPHPPTLPPANWKTETNLPDGFFGYGNITILANGDLWIQGSIHSGTTAYSIYRKGREPFIYLGDFYGEAYKYYVPERLLQTKDGILWGIGTAYGNEFDRWEYTHIKPLISRFNATTGSFEYIENNLHDIDAHSGVNDAKLDSDGFIWLLVNQPKDDNTSWRLDGNEIPSGLYRFNPNTLEVNYFLVMPDDVIFRNIMPISDGSIWMLGDKSTPNGKKTVLSRYFPETGELRPYQGTFTYSTENEDIPNLDISPYSPLFLDSSDRLWISNEGFLNHPAAERSEWYRIIQSPIFINEYVDGVGNFYRARPLGMNETSDGMFWFWSSIGTVRLNPKIGAWCLFTTYSSSVVEDHNHNLWMVADNKLYKFELGQ
jgi:hypothetical protein